MRYAPGFGQLCFGLGFLFLSFATPNSVAAAPKRVLIVHSFGNASPPATTHSTAFETELTEKMGERVDLDEVSLDVARYATLDMEEALVEFMRKRQARWQPDLVVPIGSPAGLFVAQYQDRLFPATTPIIYTGMDKRRLPNGTLEKNAAFVGESFNFHDMVEDMLQLAPTTTNIVVVIGASSLEQYWAAAIQQEWAPYTNRVSFTWLNDLSFDQILERVSKTPPHSFIFLILLMRDASGVTHNADEALARMHAVANTPVNSIFQHQLGLGIVGGRLYQAELEGVESARIAIRVLHGESITNFPPRIVEPLSPRYDWRELQRWQISEQNLPPNSTVLFREPTTWQRYRWWIVGALSVTLLEAGLIALLVVNARQRRRAEEQFEQVFESSTSALIMANRDGQIVLVNRQAEEVFGYRHEELLGLPVEKLIPERLRSQHPRQRQEYVVHPQPRPMGASQELLGLRKDGSEVPVKVGLNPVQTSQGLFVLATVLDISERRRNEKEMEQLRLQLWHADRVAQVGAITASLAHELNQPLTGILSTAQAGLRFMAGGNVEPALVHEILTNIVNDTKRAGAVINGLREMLRHKQTQREPINLADTIRETFGLLNSELVGRQIEVRQSLTPCFTVLADKAQIQQVVLNLAMNALEAMRDQPDAEYQLEIALTRDGNGDALVAVRDSGPGIPAPQQEKVFDAFWTTKQQGMGIGLAVSRSIIESHGGRLWFANNRDRGATFYFSLPIAPGDE